MLRFIYLSREKGSNVLCGKKVPNHPMHLHRLTRASLLAYRISGYYIDPIFGQSSRSKQCKPRSDATNAASDLGLNCLALIPTILDTSTN